MVRPPDALRIQHSFRQTNKLHFRIAAYLLTILLMNFVGEDLKMMLSLTASATALRFYYKHPQQPVARLPVD